MSAMKGAVRLYSVKSAAVILDRSDDYVLDRIKNGTFTRVVDLGGSRPVYRIRADDLQDFIDAHTYGSKKPVAATTGQNIKA